LIHIWLHKFDPMTRRSFFLSVGFSLAVGMASLLSTCSKQQTIEPAEHHLATQVALGWNHLLLELEWHTPGYRPPVSARMFAYAEIAAYEAALPAMYGYESLETILPDYRSLHAKPAGNYSPAAAINAAYAHMARAFFPSAPDAYYRKIQTLEALYNKKLLKNHSQQIIDASAQFGHETAANVWRYSILDSIGHDGYRYNFDRNFVAMQGKGHWEMEQARSEPALLPHWGQARIFVVKQGELAVKPPIMFDEAAPSAFFSEAMEVFSISNSRSTEAIWIAEFWSDDLPGLTVSPTGRWISITNQAIEKSALTFPKVMETYVKTTLALNDAAVICWAAKYKHQLERPSSYIQRNIQAKWTPLHHNPPFPSYPSGHAIFGAAAAQVLTNVLGEQFKLSDHTHDGRKEFVGKARNFSSFDEMAEENAYSRLLLGVHFRMDCEEGLRLGKIVGQKAATVPLHHEQVAILNIKN